MIVRSTSFIQSTCWRYQSRCPDWWDSLSPHCFPVSWSFQTHSKPWRENEACFPKLKWSLSNLSLCRRKQYVPSALSISSLMLSPMYLHRTRLIIIILDVSVSIWLKSNQIMRSPRITQFQTYLFSFSKKILVSSSVNGLIFSATVICKPRLLSLFSVITFQNLLGQISQFSL